MATLNLDLGHHHSHPPPALCPLHSSPALLSSPLSSALSLPSIIVRSAASLLSSPFPSPFPVSSMAMPPVDGESRVPHQHQFPLLWVSQMRGHCVCRAPEICPPTATVVRCLVLSGRCNATTPSLPPPTPQARGEQGLREPPASCLLPSAAGLRWWRVAACSLQLAGWRVALFPAWSPSGHFSLN